MDNKSPKYTRTDEELRELLVFIENSRDHGGFPASLYDRYQRDLCRAAEERGHRYPNVSTFKELEDWSREFLNMVHTG